MRRSRLCYRTEQGMNVARATLCGRPEQGTNVPPATLCYRAEWGTNGHILLCVHGFAITPYLLASTASESAIGQRHVVQLRPRGAHGPGALASAGRGHPSGHAGLTLPLAGHQGTARGFLQGKS